MPRVLIVDDKEENRYYLQALLTGHGFAVDAARHGAEALILARQRAPDLVVSDLLMPVMDGFTLLRHWKADAKFKAIPFVVYTATYTEAADALAAHRFAPDAPPVAAVRIRVTDTGIGIKPADLGTLFQPFRQVDSGLARQHEGTGLGLAICRRLATLMGGDVAVASEWGRGSEFTVTLPRQPRPAP